MRRRLFLTGAAALGGCSLLPQTPYVQRRNWPLVVQRDVVMPARPHGKVLLVRNFRAGPGLEARGMQWLMPDGSLHVDFYEQWAVPSAEAVEDDVRRWLAASGLFAAVIAPGSRAAADYVLEGELETFIAERDAHVARVRLAMVLLDQRPGPIKVLLQKTEVGEATLASGEPQAIAEGMRAAIVEMLRHVEADIARAIR
jgi:ABC-type uncharacterized transport system auxiliary subunit